MISTAAIVTIVVAVFVLLILTAIITTSVLLSRGEPIASNHPLASSFSSNQCILPNTFYTYCCSSGVSNPFVFQVPYQFLTSTITTNLTLLSNVKPMNLCAYNINQSAKRVYQLFLQGTVISSNPMYSLISTFSLSPDTQIIQQGVAYYAVNTNQVGYVSSTQLEGMIPVYLYQLPKQIFYSDGHNIYFVNVNLGILSTKNSLAFSACGILWDFTPFGQVLGYIENSFQPSDIVS